MKWFETAKPLLCLSPMADFTDRPFCRLVRELDNQTVLFREMLAAEALVRANQRTLMMADLDEIERPVVQQLFGSDPERMAQAAELVERQFKPDGIDINMGCPVYKAVSNFNGASLMREPERAAAIVKSVKNAISIPLSVKTRLGWSKPDEILEFIKVLDAAGADAVEVHGRTKTQAYAGQADWEAVGQAVKEVSIPVLVNGDITDPESAKSALDKSAAAGILIARGALGRPWVFKRIREYLETGKDSGEPGIEERLKIMRRHAQLQVEHYGENGLIQLRKHLPWYFKGIPAFRQYRAAAVRISTIDQLDALIDEIAANEKIALGE